MAHTASMESCVADLDLLMCSRNRSDEAEDRRARVQAERDKLAEKLRAKTQEAKELREAAPARSPPSPRRSSTTAPGTSEASRPPLPDPTRIPRGHRP